MSIQDIVSRKAEFIGRTLNVTVGFSAERHKDVTIEDIQLLENAIMFTFSDDPGGELVLPREVISSISSSESGFFISCSIYSCQCK